MHWEEELEPDLGTVSVEAENGHLDVDVFCGRGCEKNWRLSRGRLARSWGRVGRRVRAVVVEKKGWCRIAGTVRAGRSRKASESCRGDRGVLASDQKGVGSFQVCEGEEQTVCCQSVCVTHHERKA